MTSFNAFDDVLDSLKVSGLCLLAEKYPPPWAVAIPDGRQLADAVSAPPGTRVFAFHLVRRGSFDLTTKDTVLPVHTGEMVILTGSQSHMMNNGSTDKIMEFKDLIKYQSPPLDKQQNLDATELICGAFLLGNADNNPLITSLPPIIHVDVSRKSDTTLRLLAELLIAQTVSNRHLKNNMSARILEMLCAEAIRLYVEKDDLNKHGWFRGLSDAKIGAALNQIHARPQADWTVALLARTVGMSPSRFAVRFRQILKDSPMSYLTRWRMNIASRMLIETKHNIETIAQNIGYESTPAFTRAFTRYYKTPPARWRRSQQAQT